MLLRGAHTSGLFSTLAAIEIWCNVEASKQGLDGSGRCGGSEMTDSAVAPNASSCQSTNEDEILLGRGQMRRLLLLAIVGILFASAGCLETDEELRKLVGME